MERSHGEEKQAASRSSVTPADSHKETGTSGMNSANKQEAWNITPDSIQVRMAALGTPWSQPSETLSKKPSHAVPRLHTYRNDDDDVYELI